MAIKAEKLRDLLDYLNSRHSNIQFSMDRETDGYLPFLEINCYRRKIAPWVTRCTKNQPKEICT
jgi:hypothetical protein